MYASSPVAHAALQTRIVCDPPAARAIGAGRASRSSSSCRRSRRNDVSCTVISSIRRASARGRGRGRARGAANSACGRHPASDARERRAQGVVLARLSRTPALAQDERRRSGRGARSSPAPLRGASAAEDVADLGAAGAPARRPCPPRRAACRNTTELASSWAIVSPPASANGCQPVGAVASHAGQHDADGVAAERRREASRTGRRPRAVRSPAAASRADAPAPARAGRGVPPPARSRRPGRCRSRGAAGLHRRARRPSSQRTSPSVNPDAMCCTTRMGIGNDAGSGPRSRASACGPPVEAQMPITTRRAGEPCRPAGGSEPAARDGGSRARRASTFRRSRKAPRAGPPGSSRSRSPLPIASSAPAASAARPTVARPTSRGEQQDRHGASVMICSMASSPDMPGSSMSMVTRSGFSAGPQRDRLLGGARRPPRPRSRHRARTRA